MWICWISFFSTLITCSFGSSRSLEMRKEQWLWLSRYWFSKILSQLPGCLAIHLQLSGLYSTAKPRNAANEKMVLKNYSLRFASVLCLLCEDRGNHLEANFGSCAWIWFLLPSNFYFFSLGTHTAGSHLYPTTITLPRVDSLINAHLSSLFFPAWGYWGTSLFFFFFSMLFFQERL